MNSSTNIFLIAKYVGLTLLSIGLIIFSIGFFGTGSNTLTPIGIGTIVGAVFIFLIGAFFVVTEEMLANTHKGMKVAPFPKK